MPSTTFISHFQNLYTESRIPDLPYWITQKDLYGILDTLPQSVFTQEVIGESFEGRPIRLVTIGRGQTKVLVESQMHGDEPTNTRGIIDLFSIIKNYPDDEHVKKILDTLTLLVIPMLNPDGAKRFARRTAAGIDMNRDAFSLRTPEARLLKSICDIHKPAWGFNLHDQEPRYTVGISRQPVGIALLASAVDERATVTDIRRDAMKLSASIVSSAQHFLPERIAKYDDSYEYRAFGEAMMHWGIRSILIEAGYLPNDRTKETIRKVITISFLSGLFDLASDNLSTEEIYEKLPFNRKYFCEYLLKNAPIYINDISAGKQDVGLYLIPEPDYESRTVGFKLGLADLGDCSPYASTYEFNASESEIRFIPPHNTFSVNPEKNWLPVTDEPANCNIVYGNSTLIIRKGIPSQPIEELFT